MRTKLFFSLFALALCFAISCARLDEAPVSVVSGERMIVSAYWADDSRTSVRENGKIWWMPGDQINLFFGKDSFGVFTSVNEEPVELTRFSGMLNFIVGSMESTAGPSNFIAVYPFSSDNNCDGERVNLTLPYEQDGIAGSFATNFFPAVARGSTPELAFYNVCGGACFSVVTEGVQSVVFTSVDSTAMAGRIKVGFNAQGLPQVLDVTQAVDSVIVNAPKGGFVPGAYYYASMLPAAHEQGLVIRLYTNHKRAQRILDHSVNVKRTTFGKLSNIDDGLEYEDYNFGPEPGDTIEFEDPEVKRICLERWDVDKDGVFTYREAAAVDSLKSYFKSNNKLISFLELQYFTGLSELPIDAFNNCTSLLSVALPPKVKVIGDRCFKGCVSLTNIEFGAGLCDIGKSAFASCSALEEARLPSGVTQIDDYAFNACKALRQVGFSKELERIGKSAFASCSALEEAKLPSGVTQIDDYAFNACKALRQVVFPNQLKRIGASAFASCSVLEKVELAHCTALHFIGASVFQGCTGIKAPQDVTIPEAVDTIGRKAFAPFKYINLRPVVPPFIYSDSFQAEARFGVPLEGIKRYKSIYATQWRTFANWIYPDTIFNYPPSMESIESGSIRRLNLFGHHLDFIKLPPGSYENLNGKQVTISSSFWIAKTELSRAIWIDVMKSDPSLFTATMDTALFCPVTKVSWDDIQTFIAELKSIVPSSYRLPTEAQWEYAAKGGETYKYSGSDEIGEVAWYSDNSIICLDTLVNGAAATIKQPHPGANLNPNGFGLYDMSGNVAEWVYDYFDAAIPSGTDPTGPSSSTSSERVVRGGDYNSSASVCTCTYRNSERQTYRSPYVGFRLAL